jgi:hypothetical protein
VGNSGDVWIPRLVVGFLGVASLAAIVGAVVITLYGKEIPNIVGSLGTNAVTTLGIIATVLYRPNGNGNGSGSQPAIIQSSGK